MACWKAPQGSKDSSVTLSFSFKRDGTLIGPPEPTSIAIGGDEQARQQFIDAAIAAVENCAPYEFAPAFADGVAGQVFTMRFDASGVRSATPGE